MEPLLDVQALNVRYHQQGGGHVFALRDVCLQIGAGEVVGVLGESGSGKSTLAAAMLAILPPNATIDGGAVVWQGTNLLKLTSEEIERLRGNRVSLIFQEPATALHPTMRAGAQIEEVLRAHSNESKEARRQKVQELLELIFADDGQRIGAAYPHQLSGGQRQRIVIAQAIACNPGLLIADEPTASLDPVTQREIIGVLKALRQKRDLAILFVTHSAELLENFADRIVVMYAGRIIEEGGTQEVLRSPKHPYTQAMLNCRPTLERSGAGQSDSRIPVIPGDAPEMSLDFAGCAFESRCGERMKICGERMPQFSESGNGGRVRCFKFGEQESMGR